MPDGLLDLDLAPQSRAPMMSPRGDSIEELQLLERRLRRCLADGGQPLPQAGAFWGHYHVEAQVEDGGGGMGQVFRAWDLYLQRPVALKCPRSEDPRTVGRLLQEARAQARIDHPHVCKVYQLGTVGGHPYIALQWIEGRSLTDSAPQLSHRQKVRIVAQVAGGLEAAHRLGLVHRDIKPDNVLIERADGEPHPFLVDFGIVRHPEGPRLTHNGMVVGSLPYMAPERLEGARLDPRMDVWGLGATLYELFGGRPPFAGANDQEILRKAFAGDVEPLTPRLAGFPLDLERVIMKCLRKLPSRRYPSAGEVADDLDRFLRGEAVEARFG
jgi:serine/threonine protein kinase